MALDFTDCWLKPSFAKRWVLNNTEGFANNAGVREYWLRCVLAQIQGIDRLRGDERPTRILDAGCGPAIRTAHIRAKLGCEILGVDYSMSMVDQAQQFVAALPEEHRFPVQHGDVRNLNFEDDEFDVVIAYGLLMGIKEPQTAVVELMRVARTGLVVIEESPEAMSPAQRSTWEDVKDKTFPGRIFWHNYLELFLQSGGARQVIADPLVGSESWDQGTPPCYIRYIAVK